MSDLDNMNNLPIKGDKHETMSHVREGMDVFDRHGEKIGKVDRVHMGDQGQAGSGAADLADEPSSGTVAVPVTGTFPGQSNINGSGVFASVFSTDHVSNEMQQQLRMRGFIRMDSSKLLHGARYVLPDDVAHVTEEGVTLNKTYDELPKQM